MPSPLISPNLHVVLIHYPLAMLIAGTLIELFSFFWPRSSFRTAGRWMILLGALCAIPATFSGIYALRDISRIDVDTDIHWVDIKTTSPVFSHADIWQILWRHTLFQSISTAVAAVVVVVWLGSSDKLRQTLRVPLLVLLLIPVAGMILGAWLGGESIYRKGVAVEPVFPIPAAPDKGPTTRPANWINTATTIERMFPPVEQHAIMAGVFTAIAVVSIGLSFRKITSQPTPKDELILPGDPATALASVPPPVPLAPADTAVVARTINPAVHVAPGPCAPAGRYWILAFLLALLTFLGGLFVVARGADLFAEMNGQPKQLPRLLWEQIEPFHGDMVNRLAVHFFTGSAIVVLPVILALLARFAPHRKIALSVTTLVLILAVTVQVWMGVLLLFDTSDGPIASFNPPGAAGN